MAAHLPLILLPPSEGKSPGGTGPPWSAGTMSVDLDERRVELVAALARAMKGNESARAALLGVKGTALAAATGANRSLKDAPTMPAIDRYTGVLYAALDAGSLGARARTRLDRSVLVVSGLWGLVAPGDPIPDYKLKMGASLPGIRKLSTWWRPAIDERLGALLQARPRRTPVWNLLPNEHAAAWSGAVDTGGARLSRRGFRDRLHPCRTPRLEVPSGGAPTPSSPSAGWPRAAPGPAPPSRPGG